MIVKKTKNKNMAEMRFKFFGHDFGFYNRMSVLLALFNNAIALKPSKNKFGIF